MTKTQIFKSNWKNLLKPLLKPRHYYVLWNRLTYNSPFVPINTPEGLCLCDKNELVMYCGMFMENNLLYKPMIADLKRHPHPIIIDVGAAMGMFSQWIGHFNPRSLFYCFEPNSRRVDAGKTLNECAKKQMYIIWVNGPANNLDFLSKTESSFFCIKIDTDGSNIATLEGARNTLKKTKWLIIEEDKEEIQSWIAANAWYMELVARPSPVDLVYKNVNII